MSGLPTWRESIDAHQRALLRERLEMARGCAAEAARSLGMTREGYFRACRRLRIDLREERRRVAANELALRIRRGGGLSESEGRAGVG